MTGVFSNPEFLRNVRAQLRWGRMLIAGTTCAALSLVVGYAFAYGTDTPQQDWGMRFLMTILACQIVVVLIGGGVACLQSIQREKDLNTFDFQRVTRMTPLDLAVGKLFGAPVMTYFVALCLMPAAVFAAFVARARPTFVVAAYVVLLFGSVAFHAFALIISMLIERSAATGSVLVLLLVIGFTSTGGEGILGLQMTNPFYALKLADDTTWRVTADAGNLGGWTYSLPESVDVFFGWPMHHFPVLMVLYLTFTAWFLLALNRNIKRDPSIYELYTPLQSLGLALYVNLILIGFYRWEKGRPLEAQAVLLLFNLQLFFFLGVALLRNRERLRRLLRQGKEIATNWAAALWPAPYLLAGVGLASAAGIFLVTRGRTATSEWDMSLAIFRVVALVLWLIRDVLFLQWMNLRRGRRQVVLGVFYMVVVYSLSSILFATLDLYDTPKKMAIPGAVTPGAALALSVNDWGEVRNVWALALAAQFVFIGIFAFLQRQKLLELSAPAVAPEPAGPSQPSVFSTP